MNPALIWFLLGPGATVGAPPEEAVAAWRPDRTQPPLVEPPERMALPEAELVALGPGRYAHLLPVEGVRMVQVQLRFEQGRLDLCPEGYVPCQALVNQWTLASEGRDPAELEGELDRLEAELYAWVSQRDLTLSFQVPGERLEPGLALLEELIRAPSFSRKELKLDAREQRTWYEDEAPYDLSAVARAAVTWGWFPEDSVFTTWPDLEAWDRVRPGALSALHARLLAEAPVHVFVSGAVDRDQALAIAERVSAGLGGAHEAPQDPDYMGITENVFLAVDMPGQAQAALRLRTAAPPLGHPQVVRFSALDYALGGPFMSRVNQNLREEKGWTYGAGSWYSAQPEYGTWNVYVDVPAEHAGAAIREIEAEIEGLVRGGPTQAELDAAWRDEVGWWNRTLETAGRASSWAYELHDQGISAGDAAALIDALGQLTPAQTIAAADRWMGPEAPRLWVVVGDRDQLEPQLSALGWDVRWISPEQAILGTR
ncbi:MAG: insulinase family protein [Alphaproteobacteria bacterium]|nr:insulinase family protein [Alphaproteobacteria bacterium]MCB9793391.1 insulinase family protein [Alphaproteobacteria bacterium]